MCSICNWAFDTACLLSKIVRTSPPLSNLDEDMTTCWWHICRIEAPRTRGSSSWLRSGLYCGLPAIHEPEWRVSFNGTCPRSFTLAAVFFFCYCSLVIVIIVTAVTGRRCQKKVTTSQTIAQTKKRDFSLRPVADISKATVSRLLLLPL